MSQYKRGDRVMCINAEHSRFKEEGVVVNFTALGTSIMMWEDGVKSARKDCNLTMVEELRMSNFKAGDIVQNRNGAAFSNGEHELTVSKVELGVQANGRAYIWLKETGTNVNEDKLELAGKQDFEYFVMETTRNQKVKPESFRTLNKAEEYAISEAALHQEFSYAICKRLSQTSVKTEVTLVK